MRPSLVIPQPHVILSAAKDLTARIAGEILRCAQDDMGRARDDKVSAQQLCRHVKSSLDDNQDDDTEAGNSLRA
jgi:hypothetical protein